MTFDPNDPMTMPRSQLTVEVTTLRARVVELEKQTAAHKLEAESLRYEIIGMREQSVPRISNERAAEPQTLEDVDAISREVVSLRAHIEVLERGNS